MRISRPSPAMVVAILALVVACAGTATAAGVVLIKNSAQVRAGSLNGTDLKANTIRSRNLAASAVDARAIRKGSVGTQELATAVRSALTAQGFTATESVRKVGPSVPNGGQAPVAKLTGLNPGTYTLLAKTIMSPLAVESGLVGELVKDPKTGNGHCVLNGAGDVDDARAPIATPFSLFANTMHMQLTRSIAVVSDITLVCDANVPWKTSDTSIIALKLAGSTREDSTG